MAALIIAPPPAPSTKAAKLSRHRASARPPWDPLESAYALGRMTLEGPLSPCFVVNSTDIRANVEWIRGRETRLTSSLVREGRLFAFSLPRPTTPGQLRACKLYIDEQRLRAPLERTRSSQEREACGRASALLLSLTDRDIWLDSELGEAHVQAAFSRFNNRPIPSNPPSPTISDTDPFATFRSEFMATDEAWDLFKARKRGGAS